LRPPARAPVSQENREAASSDDDIQRTIDDALARVRSASDGAKHYTLRNQARLLGGIQAQARFTDSEAVRWLVDALPSTAKDTKAAKKTARWGLDVGRTAPVTLRNRERKAPDPRRKETTRTAFRLLRQGVSSADLLAELHERNSRRPDPLPPGIVNEITLWAARQHGGRRDAE
jgi:hypothetical protein